MMNAAERRSALLELLQSGTEPISATTLAKEFSVSRQIIVGDIALLRAAGESIDSTPRGYVLPREHPGLIRTLACCHSGADLERELYLMVDNGCTVLDVAVEHPVYGQISGQLQLSSRYDVDDFIQKVACGGAKPLSLLTDGVHLHRLLCPNEQAHRRVKAALAQAGLLVEE